jgi:type IV fimbrial biogenesis protein FimT
MIPSCSTATPRCTPAQRHGPRRIHRGVTLFELLAALGIVAVLSAVAVPSFRGQRNRALAVSSANSLLSTLYHARTVALLHGRPTVVCLSADGAQCLPAGPQRALGWISFQNDHSESPPRRDATETLLRSERFGSDLLIRGSRQAVTYWPISRAGTTATFTLCAGRPAEAARAIVVSQSGRPRSKTLAPQDPDCQP